MNRLLASFCTFVLLGTGLAPPAAARRRCVRRDMIVKLHYTHGGQVFIPARIACGGTAPVIIMLHGNNQALDRHPSLGGGRQLGRLVGKYIRQQLIRPVVLAEPVHHGACAKGAKRQGLPSVFGPGFSFAIYRRKLTALLLKHGIKVQSWSLVGHSGAGCCPGAGIYAAARVFTRVFVFGTSDACYGSPFYADFIVRTYGSRRTRVLNTCRGVDGYPAYKAYERTLVGRRPLPFRCDRTYYKRCVRHRAKHFYAYVTKAQTVRSHNQVFTEFMKTLLFKFFRRRRR